MTTTENVTSLDGEDIISVSSSRVLVLYHGQGSVSVIVDIGNDNGDRTDREAFLVEVGCASKFVRLG